MKIARTVRVDDDIYISLHKELTGNVCRMLSSRSQGAGGGERGRSQAPIQEAGLTQPRFQATGLRGQVEAGPQG